MGARNVLAPISPAIDLVSHGGHGWDTYRVIDFGKLSEALDLIENLRTK